MDWFCQHYLHLYWHLCYVPFYPIYAAKKTLQFDGQDNTNLDFVSFKLLMQHYDDGDDRFSSYIIHFKYTSYSILSVCNWQHTLSLLKYWKVALWNLMNDEWLMNDWYVSLNLNITISLLVVVEIKLMLCLI